MTNRLRHISAALATLALISCGGGGDDPAPDTTVASVSLSGSTNIAPGATAQMTATGRNAAGTAISGLTASWSSSTTAVATVNATGLVTALANGTSTITATIAGKSGTRQVTVQTVTISQQATVTADASNSFSPSPVDISVGGSVTWNFTGLTAHNVTFAGTTGAPQNIPDTQSASVTRTFTAAGTFNYNCTIHAGMTGTVVVH
jgi:plastocyanin